MYVPELSLNLSGLQSVALGNGRCQNIIFFRNCSRDLRRTCPMLWSPHWRSGQAHWPGELQGTLSHLTTGDSSFHLDDIVYQELLETHFLWPNNTIAPHPR